MKIAFSDKITAAAPLLKVIKIEAAVENPPTSDALWNEIEAEIAALAANYPLQAINKRPAIAATRTAYKALGKDPNRYRPSAEALCRRAVNGKGLYRLTTLVDAINLISMRTGYSIGGFDALKIEGDTLTLDAGMENEEFHAIGRGQLNIGCLPVYRDSLGGIGTPTSDVERTSLSEKTSRLLMLINVYGEETPVDETILLARRLIEQYAAAGDISIEIIAPQPLNNPAEGQ